MEIKVIGHWSSSQNAVVVIGGGISPCLMSGGSGHDAFAPWIIVRYEV